MTTPADELRTAAETLRSISSAAAPGPWTIAKIPPYTDPLIMSRYEETPDDGDVVIVGNIDVEPEDQAVVQLLHPGVGLALAKWLDNTASWLTASTHPGWQGSVAPEALAVARAINGPAS